MLFLGVASPAQAYWDSNYCDVLPNAASGVLQTAIQQYRDYGQCRLAIRFFGQQNIDLRNGLVINVRPPSGRRFGLGIRKCIAGEIYALGGNGNHCVKELDNPSHGALRDVDVTLDATFYTRDNGDCPIKVADGAWIEIRNIQIRVANPNKAFCDLDGNPIPMDDGNDPHAWIHDVIIDPVLAPPPPATTTTTTTTTMPSPSTTTTSTSTTTSTTTTTTMPPMLPPPSPPPPPPSTPSENPDEDEDADQDGLNDAVETNLTGTDPQNADTDGDGLQDGAEIFTSHTDPLKADTDEDDVQDKEDNCPLVSNPGQGDENQDAVGDACQDDQDGDGIKNDEDNCKFIILNPQQFDDDKDNIGNACDLDFNQGALPISTGGGCSLNSNATPFSRQYLALCLSLYFLAKAFLRAFKFFSRSTPLS